MHLHHSSLTCEPRGPAGMPLDVLVALLWTQTARSLPKTRTLWLTLRALPCCWTTLCKARQCQP